MAYAEDLIKLRKRVSDAVNQQVITADARDFYEATLIQIMNESEKQRQQCVAQAEQLRKQAATLDGQALAYSNQSTIVYNVINLYVMNAERAAAELLETEKGKFESKLTKEEQNNLTKLAKKQKSETKKR